MEYNWADPRKNSRVDSFMMAKVEASRVKRLTSVKATVSNQLHPSAEHKLKGSKKKKGQEIDGRPSSRLHQRESDLGNNSSNQHTGGSSFYNEFLPHSAKPPQSVFDGFDVHAAADGLFHPESNIQAFAEHDAKYAVRDSTTRSSRLSTRSTSSNHSASSRTGESDDRKLPPLSGKSDRSARLASRSDSRLPDASSSSSSNLSANRSDSDLHAPRRRCIVPSSADCDAMDLLNELDDEEAANDDHDGEPQTPSPVPHTNLESKHLVREEENNNNHENPPAFPAIELDLARKFEKLKLMMKTSREIATHRNVEDAPRPEVDEEPDIKEKRGVAEVPAKKQSRNDQASQVNTKTKQPTKVNVSSVDEKKTKKKANDMHTGAQPARKESTAIKKKSKPSSSELKTRTGVSLSDLKEEHRAALAMLHELGGPVEVDYESQDTVSKKQGVVKRTKALSQIAKATSKAPVVNAKPPPRCERPSGSADRAARLVEKLRSQIPSGREKPHDEAAATAVEPQGRELFTAALDAALQALDNDAVHISRMATADADKDEELWRRYQGDEEADGDDDDDPSAELYEDEQFES